MKRPPGLHRQDWLDAGTAETTRGKSAIAEDREPVDSTPGGEWTNGGSARISRRLSD
jgi:hypothetical protein